KELGKVANLVGASAPVEPSDISSIFSKAAATRAAAAAGTRSAVYSPDSKTLMLVGPARVIQLVDLGSGKEVGPSLGHTASLTSLWFTPDGTQLLTQDGKATHTWDVATSKDLGASELKLPAKAGSPTFVSPDGRVGVTVARFPPPAVARAAQAREA